MKKILFPLMLAITAIWGACLKEPTPAPPATQESTKVDSEVSGRSGLTITISGAYGMTLCGIPHIPFGNNCELPCPTIGMEPPGIFVFDANSATLTLQEAKFCMTNSSGSSQTVSFLPAGCFAPVSFSIPPGTSCFRIKGCLVLSGCF